MADQIRAAVAIERDLIEGAGVRDELHDAIAKYARANLYRRTTDDIVGLERDMLRLVERKWLPYARATGQASAEPVLKALGGSKLVDKGNALRGAILGGQKRYSKANVLAIRAELKREGATLTGEIEAAFARAHRDGVSRKQLIQDLVESHKGEMEQLAKATTRAEKASRQVQTVEEDLSKLGRRAKKRRRALNKDLKDAKAELRKAKRSISSTKDFFARFATRAQGHVRDGIRREVQTAQFNTFRQAGYETFTWVAVNAGDACPSCQALHYTTKKAAEWQASGGPGAADTFCGSACMCMLTPAEYTTDNASLKDPIRVGPKERLERLEEAHRLDVVAPRAVVTRGG
jgi:hypothetical protein